MHQQAAFVQLGKVHEHCIVGMICLKYDVEETKFNKVHKHTNAIRSYTKINDTRFPGLTSIDFKKFLTFIEVVMFPSS